MTKATPHHDDAHGAVAEYDTAAAIAASFPSSSSSPPSLSAYSAMNQVRLKREHQLKQEATIKAELAGIKRERRMKKKMEAEGKCERQLKEEQ